MGPEYSCALSPELARNWSAASQRRFSRVAVAVSFSGVAIQRKKRLLSVRAGSRKSYLALQRQRFANCLAFTPQYGNDIVVPQRVDDRG